jgi:hypothetical protein
MTIPTQTNSIQWALQCTFQTIEEAKQYLPQSIKNQSDAVQTATVVIFGAMVGCAIYKAFRKEPPVYFETKVVNPQEFVDRITPFNRRTQKRLPDYLETPPNTARRLIKEYDKN